jgi:phosphatidylserine/phosphatidylglycerophosphate/cardiolipin synthase-like enzyme
MARKFHIEKGRPWSILEQMLLASLVVEPATVDRLAKAGEIHRRLVIESLIRLMRAGWVELEQGPDGVLFSASPLGLVAAAADDLPAPSRRITRWMSFAVDRLTGTVFRKRDLLLLEKHVVEKRSLTENIVWVEPREEIVGDDVRSVLSALLEPDERFLGLDPAGDRPADRIALLQVRDGVIDKLPSRAPVELETIILAAAASAGRFLSRGPSNTYTAPPLADPETLDGPEPRTISFQSSDIVLGAEAHRDVLTQTLRRARHRILIHSTFIRDEAVDAIMPQMRDALRRGVTIDVLWGQEDRPGATATRDAVMRIRTKLEQEGLSHSLRVHPFSTGSHAKFIVADEGFPKQVSAVIGSCNWLYSGFDAFEASAKVRDPALVSETIDLVAQMSRGPDLHWTELTLDLARWAQEVRLHSPPGGARALGTLVAGPEHAHFMRLARDKAHSRIFVTSHRLGAASRTVVIPPAIAAARDRGIDVSVYYGIVNPEMRSGAAALTTAATGAGVVLRPVHEPRLHAKVLAWDDDNLLITSRNWLSADTGMGSRLKEVGLFVQARGAARLVVEQFAALRNYS